MFRTDNKGRRREGQQTAGADAMPAYPNWIAYGGNGALMVVWTDDYGSDTDPADIAARRLIASAGDEVCQRVGNEVRCDSGRTGSLSELRLASFGLDRRDKLSCCWARRELRSCLATWMGSRRLRQRNPLAPSRQERDRRPGGSPGGF